MFNALNRFISRLDGDAPAPQRDRAHGTFGFQVLRNTNLSLAIEPWFDFVVGINGRMIDDPDPRLFAQEVRNCAGGMVTLGLWSAKGQRTRAVPISVPADTASLGLTLQWTAIAAVYNIWHVLDVPANSPADAAGLLPYSDYILGTPDGVLHGEGGLGELVEDHIGRPLRIWVYNNEYDVTRELTIHPSRDWGGEGALGCVLGHGALHRLPAPLSEPVEAPGETMFDGDSEAAASAAGAPSPFFVPAEQARQGPQTTSPPPAPTSPGGGEFLVPAQMVGATAGGLPPRGKKKEKHHHHHHHGADQALMGDYLREEEERSRELDGPGSGKRATTPVAPPPKGGPPRAGAPPPPPPPPPAATSEDGKADGEGVGGEKAG